MKGLATLIKLHKRKLDELRRKMGSLENQKSQLLLLSEKLQKELEHELQLAGLQPEMGSFFGGFAKRIQLRQQNIANEVKALDKQMDELREEIAIEFSEQKKFEIAQNNAKQREHAELNRKETIMLDEIAGQQHRRKIAEESDQ